MVSNHQWRIPGGGGQRLGGASLLFDHFFRKLHENVEIFDPDGGGGCLVPPRSANDNWTVLWIGPHFKDSPCYLYFGGNVVTPRSASQYVASSNNTFRCNHFFFTEFGGAFQLYLFPLFSMRPISQKPLQRWLYFDTDAQCKRALTRKLSFSCAQWLFQGSTHKQRPGGDCERAADEGRDYPSWVQLWGPQPLR